MMDFTELYKGIRSEIKNSILRMWQEIAPRMIEMYKDQLDDILNRNISPNIVVEDMSLWEPSGNDDNWTACVNPRIWRRYKKDDEGNKTDVIEKIPFSPYKHQYKSWKALKNNKSIVVTTGTGSGKTECFMIPLIHDLAFEQPQREPAVEALFLYPLNALMEDQKERMSDYITFSESNLTFAVYNRSTPESEVDGELYPHEIGTRDEIRREKPNILFTNPSMLERMLLREKDSGIFSQGLKWIVIDETHTFRGSAGAELALLLRRVLKACNIQDVGQVRFATSSATIGNSLDKLKEFITDITGQEDVEVITGQRTTPKALDAEQAQKLHEKGFVYLNDLFPDIPNEDVESQLQKINELTQNGLKVRLHFYVQTLNRGLYVNPLDLTDDGSKFKLLKEITLSDNKPIPSVINAYYCPDCGELLGKAELDEDMQYHRSTYEISSLDDQVVDDDDDDDANGGIDDEDQNSVFIALYNNDCDYGEESGSRITINGNSIVDDECGNYIYAKGKCPCCGKKDSKKSPIASFHLSANFLSRLSAPKLLGQTTPHPRSKKKDLPSKGCKYITFVDSRQGAAGPSLKQNLETETVWVTGVLYKELYGKYKDLNDKRDYKKRLEERRNNGSIHPIEMQLLNQLNDELQHDCAYLTWNDALGALLNDDNCERMYNAFYVKGDTKEKYVLAALYRVMHKRAGMGKNCPENWGILTTYYPDIVRGIAILPNEVENFNALIDDDKLKIHLKDWIDLIKIFIDYDIRSNESMFFKHSNNIDNTSPWWKIDISSIRTFRTENDGRKPIPLLIENSKDKRCAKLLCRLLGKSKYADLSINERTAIDNVLVALFRAIDSIGIAENSCSYDGSIDGWTEANNGKYLNLTRIAFKLYEDNVWFDENLRLPLDVTFKGYSPYQAERGTYSTVCTNKVKWEKLTSGEVDLKAWFDTNRNLIAHRWTSVLERIFTFITSENNTLYIQAENTAQVPRSVIKEQTKLFKGGEINIMACSTTMEMGVDLGDLELVVLNNIPPYPANYKQRAGRAGRGDQNRSTCITFCGNDAIGLATAQRPLEELINREILPPSIDLYCVSKQLVQRHINSFLFRTFIAQEGVVINNDTTLSEFFSRFIITHEQNPNTRNSFKRIIFVGGNGQTILPSIYENDSIIAGTNHQESLYHKFVNWLGDIGNYDNTQYDSIRGSLEELIAGTSLFNVNLIDLIDETRKAVDGVALDIHKELLSIKEQWDDNNYVENGYPIRQGVSLYWKFVDAIDKPLIQHFASHQFTPNANMPVGIVELITDKSQVRRWRASDSENASRDLRTALVEYMPGNNVWINGRTYRVGGVDWNKSFGFREVKQCAAGHRWLSNETQCPECGGAPQNWRDFGRCMRLLTPTAYLTTGSVSRETKKDRKLSNIGVELIGAGDWNANQGHRLYTYRTNEDLHNSQILYYDLGQYGYGYHICRKCGYVVAATSLYNQNDSQTLMKQMFPLPSKSNSDAVKYHSILGNSCRMPNDINDAVYHNIVLGGEIQTDYCEIAIYEKRGSSIARMNADSSTSKIGYTLGILLCRGLAKELGCERGELDFITRAQNGELSVCIFDVAKGGSGRSKRIPQYITSLLDLSRKELQNCDTVEKILDKTTMKYADLIDIERTRQWLEEEYVNRITSPTGMPQGVELSSYSEIENEIVNNNDAIIFADGASMDFWNYRDIQGNSCWLANRRRIRPSGANKFKLIVVNAQDPVSVANFNLLNNIKDWADLYTISWTNKDYYPLAIVNGVLYITPKSECTRIDENWANDEVWKIAIQNWDGRNISLEKWEPQSNEHTVNYRFRHQTQINSKDLIDTVLRELDCIYLLNPFKDRRIKLEYADQYVNVPFPLATTIIIQAIQRVIELSGCSEYELKVRTSHKSSGEDCKNMFKSAFPEINFVVQDKDMPHDRSLKITDVDNGYNLSISPDAGFAWGWGRDNRVAGNPYGDNYDDNVSLYAYPREGIKFNIESNSGE